MFAGENKKQKTQGAHAEKGKKANISLLAYVIELAFPIISM